MSKLKCQIKFKFPNVKISSFKLSHWDLGFDLTLGFWHLTLISCFLCLWFPSFTLAEEPNPSVIALSLKVLQQQLKDGQHSSDLVQLGGIKQIDGYIIDTKNQDVILFGNTSNGTELSLDDFIIALRSVWVDESPPGCSIDPKETTLRSLRNFNQQFTNVTSTTEAETVLSEFQKLGTEEQNVRVLGIPRDTHFAKVMVDADYLTKRVSNGTAVTNLPGFTSLSEMVIEQAKKDILNGKHPQLTMYNRFWFTPGKLQFDPGKDIVRLTQCEVKLLTEQQFLTQQGKLVAISNKSVLGGMAQQFVREFTNQYDEIAKAEPIFIELKSLFRLVAIAKALQHEDAFTTAGININYLLNQYSINRESVPVTLPGITDIKKLVIQQEHKEARLWLLSFGGVDMDIKIDPKVWPTPKSKGPTQPSGKPNPTANAVVKSKKSKTELDTLRNKILNSRPKTSNLKWTVAP